MYEVLDRTIYRFRGADRKKFLNGLVSNDVAGLAPGQGLSACLLTPKGKLLADFELYDRPDYLLALVPRRAARNFTAAISKRIVLSETKMEDITGEYSLFLVLNAPSAAGDFPYDRFGVPGFFRLIPRGQKILPEAKPVGVQTIEVLRVEQGLPAFGVDMDEDSLPLEARLEDAISFTKGCYMGQETVARIHNLGHVNKILVGLKCSGPVAPGSVVFSDGAEVGRATSAAFSPRFGCTLALATVKTSHSAPGTRLIVGSGEGIRAEVVVLPRWS